MKKKKKTKQKGKDSLDENCTERDCNEELKNQTL